MASKSIAYHTTSLFLNKGLMQYLFQISNRKVVYGNID